MKTIKNINLDNNRTYIFIHIILAFFVFLCFRAGIDNFFAGDDFDWIFDAIKIMHRPSVLITTLQGHFIRPITTLFFLVNLLIAGGNPVAQHLTTILLHVVNVILLSYVLGRLCQNRLAGLLGALFWGVNYKHTEAVFLTYGVSDTFVLVFWLGSLAFLLSHRKILAVICFILALFSKENAVLLPFLVTLYGILLVKHEKRTWLKQTIPLWIFSVLYLGLRNYVTAGDISYLTIDWHALPRFWENMLSQIGPDVTYVRLVWLAGQPSLLPGWIAAILFVILGIAVWKIPREYRFGLLWMCITMLPTVFVVYQTPRYRYIPLIGLGMIVGQGISEMLTYFRKKNSQMAILGICTVFTLILVYFIIGVNLEEQDYAFFGEIHRQAAQSFQKDILPHMPEDTQAIAVFLRPDSRKWEEELYKKFLLKPWYFPGTYKWAYIRPHGILGGLAGTHSFVSYCAYGYVKHPLFVSVPYEEFRKRLLSGEFYSIIHDYETNTFKFGADSLKPEIVRHVDDENFYYFLQPGRFDSTSTGAAYLSWIHEFCHEDTKSRREHRTLMTLMTLICTDKNKCLGV
jgi:hypothetical protein